MKRLSWADSHPLTADYYDNEWGRRSGEQYLFEMLVLESFQAGLSWLTVLKKRSVIAASFDQFDIDKIAHYSDEDIERIMKTPDMIRHRLKITSTIRNAQVFREVQQSFGSFKDYLLSFTAGQTVIKAYSHESDIPVQSELSRTVSQDMKKRGFKFIGPVIIYTYLSAVGIIQDLIEEDEDDEVS
ncbi:DNA-3-methyladenine glycosylase I [Macrococcus carouselicus]|uniref:DNA-3-methyladenine glycosylase I n=1 Tax=Macrococcus carouselicus TaxID=69969 RepID=A0A9Q8CLA6_9STAP|nr:DNA-3-methyladenine glycosylase I [Macrococcus carouselicus]TDM02503.1 DNA-3-methyladenine glycosylase I [Macrococcus carouselicus]